MMHMISEKDAARFVAALDKVDVALLAIRMEFETLARESAERLAARQAEALARNSAETFEHREAAPA